MTKKFNFEARFFTYMEKPPETETKPDLRVFNALKESYRRPLMNYPSAQINPAKVVSLFGNTINTGLNAVIDRVTDVFRMFLVHLTQCIPTSVEDTMNFERKLHQEVARKCLDPFMGEILQEAITSPAVVCKAEKVL